MEYFTYLVERLRELGAPGVRVYGGGGGTITPDEIETLHGAGVTRIFSPEDGRSMGLEGMIRSIVEESRERSIEGVTDELERLSPEAEAQPRAAVEGLAALIRRERDGLMDGRHR